MSDLREAIQDAAEWVVRDQAEARLIGDAVIPIVEAWMREHDRGLMQAFIDNGVYAVRWKAEERERIRQRIEALREAVAATYSGTGYEIGFEDAIDRVLEAL